MSETVGEDEEGPRVDRGGIAASLVAARERLGWSRETLAYHSGVSWSGIAQIESGRRQDVRLSTLSQLAEALGVTVDYLVHGGRPMTPVLLQHGALMYGSNEELLRAVLPYLVEGIERSEFLFVVTTSANTELIRNALGRDAQEIQFARAEEWYRSPSQALTGYRELLRDRCHPGAPWVRVLGEPGWAGRSEVQLTAWARYEAVINLVFASVPASVVCLYDTRSAPNRALTDVQRTHPQIYSASGVGACPLYCDPEELLLESG